MSDAQVADATKAAPATPAAVKAKPAVQAKPVVAAKVAVPKAPKAVMFDKNREHGEIYSSTGHPVAAWYQDGKHFDNEGKRVMLPGDVEAEAAHKKAMDKTRQSRADSLRKRADLVEAGDDDAAEVTGDDGSEIDLAGWAKGEVPYRYAAVREAIMEKFSRLCLNEREARSFLVESRVIPPAAAKQYRIRTTRANSR